MYRWPAAEGSVADPPTACCRRGRVTMPATVAPRARLRIPDSRESGCGAGSGRGDPVGRRAPGRAPVDRAARARRHQCARDLVRPDRLRRVVPLRRPPGRGAGARDPAPARDRVGAVGASRFGAGEVGRTLAGTVPHPASALPKPRTSVPARTDPHPMRQRRAPSPLPFEFTAAGTAPATPAPRAAAPADVAAAPCARGARGSSR